MGEAIKDVITKVRALNKELESLGVTKPKPKEIKCRECGDVGYLRTDYPLDHPLFGQVVPCPTCGKDPGVYLDEHGLLPADRALTWKDIKDVVDSISEAKWALVDALDAGYGWVYLFGGYGTAKTLLLKTAVAVANRAGSHAVYTRMSDMLDEIREGYDSAKPNEAARRRLEWYSSVGVLAIDEVEKVSETPWVKERRFQLLDRRYEASTRQRAGVTILAGNVEPTALDGAIASRVLDERFAVVDLRDVPDLRQAAKIFGGDNGS